jgi:uncharacterized protein with HEPN domain
MRDDLLYLKHLLDAIGQIESYLAGVSYEQFIKNRMMIDAVVRELEIIGEATNNLSMDIRQSHSEIPARDIVDMRNVLIHEYFGINTKIVWDTCQNELPQLKQVIMKILSE